MQLKKVPAAIPNRQHFAQCADGSWNLIRNASDVMLNSSLFVLDENKRSDTTLAHVGTLNKEDFVICGDCIGFLAQRPIQCLDGKYMIMNDSGVMKLTGFYIEVLQEAQDDDEGDDESDSEVEDGPA